MQRALGDIIKRKTHKNTTTCITYLVRYRLESIGVHATVLTVETGK